MTWTQTKVTGTLGRSIEPERKIVGTSFITIADSRFLTKYMTSSLSARVQGNNQTPHRIHILLVSFATSLPNAVRLRCTDWEWTQRIRRKETSEYIPNEIPPRDRVYSISKSAPQRSHNQSHFLPKWSPSVPSYVRVNLFWASSSLFADLFALRHPFYHTNSQSCTISRRTYILLLNSQETAKIEVSTTTICLSRTGTIIQ